MDGACPSLALIVRLLCVRNASDMKQKKSVLFRCNHTLNFRKKKKSWASKVKSKFFNSFSLYRSLLAVLLVSFLGIIFGILAKFSFGRNLLLKHPKLFSFGFFSHEGPSEETMKNTKFSITFFGSLKEIICKCVNIKMANFIYFRSRMAKRRSTHWANRSTYHITIEENCYSCISFKSW